MRNQFIKIVWSFYNMKIWFVPLLVRLQLQFQQFPLAHNNWPISKLQDGYRNHVFCLCSPSHSLQGLEAEQYRQYTSAAAAPQPVVV